MPIRVDEAKWKSLQRIQNQDRREITQVAKAGYLWKRGKSFGRWLRRWYVVKNGSMSYSHTPQEAAAHDSVRVFSLVRSVKPLETQPRKHTTPEGVHHLMHGMVIESSEGDSVVLYAQSHGLRDQWVALFKQATSSKFVTDLYDVDINRPLGCGAFATVVKGVHRVDGNKYAVKIISRSAFQECAEMLHREINILHMLGHHKHIVSLKEVLHAPLRVYMVFDFCDGGELVDRVTTSRPMGEKTASRIFRELMEALVFLHDQGVAHMDLKPENIVFQSRDADSPIKLIDFSLATFFDQPTEPGGTPEFVAPEIVRDPNAIAEGGVGGEIDMWAAGILLYFLLSGRTPFDDRNVQKILQNVMGGRWGWRGKHWEHVSKDAKGLIRRLLTIDPSKRITARQALNHPWVNGSLDLPDVPYLCTIPERRSTINSKPPTLKPAIAKEKTGAAGLNKAVKFLSPEKLKPLVIGAAAAMSPRKQPAQGPVSPASPATPLDNRSRSKSWSPARATSSELQAITPHKDVVEDRIGSPLLGSPERPSTGKKSRQPTIYLTPHAVEVLSSIAQTRQSPLHPRHSPKVGMSELHILSARQGMRNALLEVAKSPERLSAITPSRKENPDCSKRADAIPPELRMSLFANSPGKMSDGSPKWSIQSRLAGPSTPDNNEAPYQRHQPVPSMMGSR